MESFVFDNSIKILSGITAIANLPFELSQAGCDRPMVICDESSFRVGFHDQIKQSLSIGDIQITTTFYKIAEIAKDDVCEKIIKVYKMKKCDCIIALGNKSAITTAKAAKIMLCEDVSSVDHYKNSLISDYAVREVPLFVVPTNIGTGVEASNFVRVYGKNNIIYEFNTPYAVSNAIFVDPIMTDILPPKTIASYILYAMAVAVECFDSLDNSSLICKAYADAALKTMSYYAEKCLLRNSEMEYRYKVMEGVVLAGAAASLRERGLLEVLSDAISDRYCANYQNIFAILFRKYIVMQQKNKDFGYALNSMISEDDFSLYAKENRGQKLLSVIEDIYQRIESYVDFNSKLSSLNVKKEDFEAIADDCLKVLNNDNEQVSKEEIIDLLDSCY